MPTKPQSQDLVRVAALGDRVDHFTSLRDTAHQDIAELKSRRSALGERLAEVQASQPDDDGAVLDEPLIEALAADPSCSPDPGAIAEAAKRHAALQVSTGHWRATIKLHEGALAKLDREMAGATGKVEEAENERVAAWRTFVTETHAYLLQQFRDQFEQLYSETLAPLIALQQLDGGDGRTSLVSIGMTRVDDTSSIKLTGYGASGRFLESLFPKRRGDDRALSDGPERIRALRELLRKVGGQRAGGSA